MTIDFILFFLENGEHLNKKVKIHEGSQGYWTMYAQK